MATQVREIRVVVDTSNAKGLQTIADGFKNSNKAIKDTSTALDGFKNAFLAIQGLSFAGIGVREIASAADSIQKLNDRLKLSEGSASAAKVTLQGLVVVANNTKTSIEDVAQVYSRLNLSLKQTGISSDALLGFTNALQNSFRISGATAAEATAATIQLSQGLASGQLRGQELRSVLEQNALAGDILAKQFKTTRGELLKFSEKNGGLDATGVLTAFANAAKDINEQAAKLKPTLSEGITTEFNTLKVSLGEVNEKLGGTEKILSAVRFGFENLGSITLATAALIIYSKQAVIASAATTVLTGALGLLKSLLIGITILLSPLYIATTLAVAGIALLGVSVYALATNFGGVNDKAKQFLIYLGLMDDQAKEAKKVTDSFYAATSAQNNYVTSAKEGGKVLEENLNPALGDFSKTLLVSSANLGTAASPIDRYSSALKDFAAAQVDGAAKVFKFKTSLAELNVQFSADGNVSKYNAGLKQLQIQEIDQKFKDGKLTLEEYNKKLQEINFGKSKKSLIELRLDLGVLNTQFAQGKFTIGEYSDAIEDANLDKLTKDLNTGKTNVIAFQTALNAHQVREYRRALADGEIGIQQYVNGNIDLALRQINLEFQSGTKDVYEYNKALVETSNKFLPGSALFVGTQNYIASAGTLSQNIANVVTSTFGNLENTLIAFTKNGKFQFREFATAVLDDLNRIIIRSLIIRPLAQGLLGAISTSGPDRAGGTTQASKDYLAQAKGGAWNNGVQFFAQGGVVSSPTAFAHSGGLGIMGEKGPEAILPLTRGANGNLGVASSGGSSNVVVNITNNTTGSEVQQKESTNSSGDKVLDIIITQKVKQAFGNGSLDKVMSTQYGLRRKGN